MPAIFRTLLIVSFCIAGCASTPAARHYTLSADANESHRIAADKRKIEIVSLRIPDTWDRPQIVLAKSAKEISLGEFHRWAAPLRAEIPRVVARNLTQILDSRTLWLRRDFVGMQPDLRVQITIDHIEAVPGEALRLQAKWLIRGEPGNLAHNGRTQLSVPLAEHTYDAVVAATGHALLAMSIDLARDIQAIP